MEECIIATVSVIIPVFNRRQVIGRALDSVLNQTRPADEIIVVDDGSTDGTAELVAARYPGVRLIRQTNRGAGAARNNAIEQATGDLIALLDSDDAWLPDKLRTQIAVFAEQPCLGLLATQKFRDRENYPVRALVRPRVRRYPFTTFMRRTRFHTSSVIIPKLILDEVGRFDESLTASEDCDLWLRVAYLYPVARIEQPLVAVFGHENSLSLDRPVLYHQHIQVLAKWNPSRPDNLDVERRISRTLYQHYIFSFIFLNTIRLLRHTNVTKAGEFLQHAVKVAEPASSTRLLCRILLFSLNQEWQLPG